jgi:hypothetical protein
VPLFGGLRHCCSEPLPSEPLNGKPHQLRLSGAGFCRIVAAASRFRKDGATGILVDVAHPFGLAGAVTTSFAIPAAPFISGTTRIAAVVAVAQWSGNAGPGAWAMALSALFCLIVVVLSLRRGAGYVTRGDWITFAAALSAIPMWIVTDHPLAAVIIITLVDVSAFYITIRKVMRSPHEESASFYAIALLQYILSVLAIASYNLTTVLNPAVLIVTMAIVIGAILHLQRSTPQSSPST